MSTFRDKVWYEYRISEGTPVRHGHLIVTPISRVLALRLPYWGFVWNRPLAVRVEDGQSTKELPIVDVTLLARIGLYTLGLALASVVFLAGRSRQR